MGSESYEPTYRQRDVDDTLDNHDTRLSRLEKIALIGAGYGLADGWNIVESLVQLI